METPSKLSKWLTRIDIIAGWLLALFVAGLFILLQRDDWTVRTLLPGALWILLAIILAVPAIKLWHYTVGTVLAVTIGIFVALVRSRR